MGNDGAEGQVNSHLAWTIDPSIVVQLSIASPAIANYFNPLGPGLVATAGAILGPKD